MQDEILNLETLMQIVGSSKEEIASFFELFKEQSGLDIQELNKYITEKNYGEIAKMAHKLKSSYGSIGSKSGYDILSKLENIAKTNADFKEIDDAYAVFLEIQMKILGKFGNYLGS